MEYDKEKTYTIAGRTFMHEPITWAQAEMLGETVFKGVDLKALEPMALARLLQQHGPLILAICIRDSEQSRAIKAAATMEEIRGLERWLKLNGEPAELRAYAQDFFALNPPANLWTLLQYSAEPTQTTEPPTPSGSESQSASSREGTLQSVSIS